MPFDQRVLIFRSLVAADKERRVSTDGIVLDCLPFRATPALQIGNTPALIFSVQSLPIVHPYV